MRIALTVPEGHVTAESLGVALEAATRLAQHEVAAGDVPEIRDAIDDGVRWRPEPPGDESFDAPSTVLRRSWGDCDDLAPWLAAEMRENGFDEGASAIAVPSGPGMWHAIVRGSDGSIYDPSRWAGMPHEVVGQRMPVVRPLLSDRTRPAIQVRGGCVRCDLPGVRAMRGCCLGSAYIVDGVPDDVGLAVQTLRHVIATAIDTARLAWHGDPLALRRLAVVYRVLRGDDPAQACAIEGVTRHQIGMPCLAALGPLASAAASAGTIAAVVGPLALALEKMAGSDTDFGRIMATVRQIVGPVQLVSAAGAGIASLAASGNIPIALESGIARWYETLQSPLSAAGVDARRIPEVASALAWTERNLGRALPPDLATRMSPAILDRLGAKDYKGAVDALTSGVRRYLADTGQLPFRPEQAEKQVAAWVSDALGELAGDPVPPPGWTFTEFPGVPGPFAFPTPGQRAHKRAPQADPLASALADVAATAQRAAEDAADDVRAELRSPPPQIIVPPGWPEMYWAACEQIPGACDV